MSDQGNNPWPEGAGMSDEELDAALNSHHDVGEGESKPKSSSVFAGRGMTDAELHAALNSDHDIGESDLKPLGIPEPSKDSSFAGKGMTDEELRAALNSNHDIGETDLDPLVLDPKDTSVFAGRGMTDAELNAALNSDHDIGEGDVKPLALPPKLPSPPKFPGSNPSVGLPPRPPTQPLNPSVTPPPKFPKLKKTLGEPAAGAEKLYPSSDPSKPSLTGKQLFAMEEGAATPELDAMLAKNTERDLPTVGVDPSRFESKKKSGNDIKPHDSAPDTPSDGNGMRKDKDGPAMDF